MTTRWTVKNVTDTTITMNITVTYPGSPPIYEESTIPKSQIIPWDFGINNRPSGYNVTKVGTETISIKWGSRSADHYIVTYQGDPATTDIWIRSGIVLKIQTTYMNRTITTTLTDTNISQITNA